MDKIEIEIREKFKDIPDELHSSKIGEHVFYHGSREARISWELGLARLDEKLKQSELELLLGPNHKSILE